MTVIECNNDIRRQTFSVRSLVAEDDVKTIPLALLLILTLNIGAMAQRTKLEVFGGYSMESITPCGIGCRESETAFPMTNFNGWNASLTGYLYKSVGVTADFSGHYASHIVFDPVVGGHRYSYLFGPSYGFRGRVGTLFVHALFGQISQEWNQLSNLNYRKFAWAAGGGLDVNVSRRFSMRLVQLDYERSSVPSFGTSQAAQSVIGLRYSGGVVIKF